MYKKCDSGFTLVELSIVLIVIALLAATITVGKSLIQTAKIRSLISQMREIEIATNTFIENYGALPGDFADAQKVWGSSACPIASPQCPGNGDGQVGFILGGNGGEMHTFFTQLGLADLIDKKYNGSSLPETRFKKIYMAVIYYDVFYNAFFPMNKKLII